MDQSECDPGTFRARPRELILGKKGQYYCVPFCKIVGYDQKMTKTAGADTGGCTSCTEDHRIFRSKFLQLVFQFS